MLARLNNVKKSFNDLKWYEWLMGAIMVIIAGQAVVTAFTTGSANGNPMWLTIINFISAICGVVCIFFCAKASISNFAFAVVNTTVYIIYLLYWKIWGTAALEILFYTPINFISWYYWVKHRDEVIQHKTKAKKLTINQNLFCAFLVLAGAYIYHMILVNIGGTVPWLDAFTLSIGIVAVILEMLRYSEQYVWWIITDFIAVAMYIVKFDPVYLTKKTIYLIMAIIGLYNWLKLQKTRNTANE